MPAHFTVPLRMHHCPLVGCLSVRSNRCGIQTRESKLGVTKHPSKDQRLLRKRGMAKASLQTLAVFVSSSSHLSHDLHISNFSRGLCKGIGRLVALDWDEVVVFNFFASYFLGVGLR